MKEKTHMIISIDKEKAFDKNSTSCHTKNSQQTMSRRELPRSNNDASMKNPQLTPYLTMKD